MSVVLSAPEDHHLHYLVRFHAEAPPSRRWVQEVVRRWLEGHASPSFAARLEAHRAVEPVRISWASARDLPPPSREHLLAVGLGVEEQAVLAQANLVAILHATHTPDRSHLGLWSAVATARALAEQLGGVIEDVQTTTVLPLDTCRDDLPPEGELHLGDHARLWATEEPEGWWIATEGLSSVALPELQMGPIPPDLLLAARILLPLAATQLHELALEAEGEALHLDTLALPLVHDRPPLVLGLSNGEPFADLSALRLHPPGDPRASPMPLLLHFFEELLPELLGEPIAVPVDDPDIQAAVDLAVSELPRVRSRFRRGLPGGARLLLRAAFPAGAGTTESLWVEVDTWTRHRIAGTLSNIPLHARHLRLGQRVRFTTEVVEDWVIEHVDGRREGARTHAVLAARATPGLPSLEVFARAEGLT